MRMLNQSIMLLNSSDLRLEREEFNDFRGRSSGNKLSSQEHTRGELYVALQQQHS